MSNQRTLLEHGIKAAYSEFEGSDGYGKLSSITWLSNNVIQVVESYGVLRTHSYTLEIVDSYCITFCDATEEYNICFNSIWEIPACMLDLLSELCVKQAA